MSTEDCPPAVLAVGESFWNIRAAFKIAGLLNIGTQASLVRRASGSYVLVDTCGFDEATRRWLQERTDGGNELEAIINLHPFHTVHVAAAHALFPRATLYGTARHRERLADLPWETLRVEDPAFHALFAGDFELSVPRGVDFIPSDEKLHFSSVLAFHRASKTLHVDDTLNHTRLPLGRELVAFHPTLAKVLERRAGAAAEFREWARGLIEQARDTENLCAAHTSPLLGRRNRGASIAARIERALGRVEGKLHKHERQYD